MFKHNGPPVLLLVLAAALGSLAPIAQPRAQEDQQPAVLTADEVAYDQTLDIVVARGDVEIFQGERLLRAQTVTYNRRTDIVTATGDVTLVEPTGEIVFAEYAELTGDLRDGFVQQVSLLLEDDSRLIANSGVRIAGEVLQVDRAVYSPCELCAENPREAPLWQIRAVSVTHDRRTRDVVYRDAFLDLFGIPVFYTPYFSHPDPTVDRRTGFLTPVFGSSSALGPFVRGYYYIDIEPSQDATLEVGATRDAGFVFGGEYRRRFENGSLVVQGSVNQSDRQDFEGGVLVTEEDAFRWHLFGEARYDLSENWRTGLTVQRASDDTYLDVFEYSDADVLESRAFAEGFHGRSYALAEAFTFQDLRPNGLDQATILPWLSYDYVGEPDQLWGGQLFGSASLLQLIRDEDVDVRRTPTEGVDTRRLSFEGGWRRELYTDIGVVANISASVHGDIYWSDDVPDGSDLRDDVTAARLYPTASVTARYPFVRQGESSQQLIEPIVAITAAPEIDDEDDIPNNDSLDFEFDEINLFRTSRFPGIDRVDDGLRFTYGVRAGIYGADGRSSTLFVGQSYQVTGGEDFPAGSGLDDDFSDLVGRLTVNPGSYLNFDWRFRVDPDDFEASRNEITALAGVPEFRLGATYTFVNDVSGLPAAEDTEELVVRASSQFAEYWRADASITRDIEAEATRRYSVGITYADECFTFNAILRHDLTEDRDDSSGYSIFLSVNFLNLGGFSG